MECFVLHDRGLFTLRGQTFRKVVRLGQQVNRVNYCLLFEVKWIRRFIVFVPSHFLLLIMLLCLWKQATGISVLPKRFSVGERGLELHSPLHQHCNWDGNVHHAIPGQLCVIEKVCTTMWKAMFGFGTELD